MKAVVLGILLSSSVVHAVCPPEQNPVERYACEMFQAYRSCWRDTKTARLENLTSGKITLNVPCVEAAKDAVEPYYEQADKWLGVRPLLRDTHAAFLIYLTSLPVVPFAVNEARREELLQRGVRLRLEKP